MPNVQVSADLGTGLELRGVWDHKDVSLEASLRRRARAADTSTYVILVLLKNIRVFKIQ